MKTNKKYALLALGTMLAVVALTAGKFSSAQTVPPLSCSENASSVGLNQTMTLTASGGNGVYAWSGQNLNITNNTGNQFIVSYPTAGTYPVTVTSDGLSATCNVVVTNSTTTTGTTTPLVCAPSVQTVLLGQVATVSASGGNGTYAWSAPDLAINNPSGAGFSANYATTGTHVLTVTSNGLTSTCDIIVEPATSAAGTTPGLPNTGGGYGHWNS